MKESVSRKLFLKSLMVITAAPAVLFSNIFSRKKETDIAAGGSSLINDCGATDRATAGPFYISHAAKAHNINYKNLPGKAMMISGTVFGGSDMKTPLANAQVEIWHADDDGRYHPQDRGDIKDFNAEEINLRGIQVTGKNGKYSFESIIPNLYGSRRRHLHWKIVADGHVTLITQSYWLDEKGTAREKRDGTDRNTEECRYVDFKKNDKGITEGVFDIYLVKN
jgi:protocatechuate 3,4-dioxygenase beta subunit